MPAADRPRAPDTASVIRPTAKELQQSLHNTCDPYLGKRPFWLFAYGSLIWRPECPTEEACRARLDGYHRGLYLWSDYHRGTPRMPGLVLGLDAGGHCAGMAYRLPEQDLRDHLGALWSREMVTWGYQPKWVNCQLEDGRQVKALTFVLRREHTDYAGQLPDAVLRQVFDHARGIYGTTLDYVQQTARSLRQMNMPDHALEALLERCQP